MCVVVPMLDSYTLFGWFEDSIVCGLLSLGEVIM